MKPIHKLNDSMIKAAKAEGKDRKLSDGEGLYLLVKVTGGKLWRFDYRYLGKAKTLALGKYPDVTLKKARAALEEAREGLTEGKDPNAVKKQKRQKAVLASANTFSLLAGEVIEKLVEQGLSATTLEKNRWFASLLDKGIGALPISEIQSADIIKELNVLQKKGNFVTARRVRGFASRVFRYAIITGRCQFDPAANLTDAIAKPKEKHHAAITEPKAVGALLRAIEGYSGEAATKYALQLAPHLFVRPGELRHAEWSEFDFDQSVWRIPAGKMKMKVEHVVPLSAQVRTILCDARIDLPWGRYVFQSLRTKNRPMSENTLNAALRRLGYTGEQMTSHGFRTTASTLLNESRKWSPDAIERALAHGEKDKVRGAYDRSEHWPERVEMAQWWSDYLDALRLGGRPKSR